jgi:hypothetical protein
MRKRAHTNSYQLAIHTFFELRMQAALFRSMAGEYLSQDPAVSTTMRDNADFFETLATDVHTAALDIDDKACLSVRPLYRDSAV